MEMAQNGEHSRLSKFTEREITAYHEAAHAVARLHYKQRFKAVYLAHDETPDTVTVSDGTVYGKRVVFPTGIPVGFSLTMLSWFRQRERKAARGDFALLRRSGALSS
jgi:hypothetical protein